MHNPSTRPASARRKFLSHSSALTVAAASALGGSRVNAQAAPAAGVTDPALLPPNVPPWTRNQGGSFINPPYGLPSRHEARVVRVLPSPSRLPDRFAHTAVQPARHHHTIRPDV